MRGNSDKRATERRFVSWARGRSQKAISFFMPDGVQPDTVLYFRLQAIIACSLIVGGSGVPFILAFLLMGYTFEALVVLWSFALFYCLPVFVRRGGSAFGAAHAFSATYYQCHLFLSVLFGGVSAPNTMWMTGLPIVSVLIGGVRHGFLWGGIAATTVAGLYLVEVLQLYEFTTTLTLDDKLFIHTTGMVGLLFAVFGSAIAYEGLKNSALARRKRIEAQLIQANSDLTELDAQKTSFFQNISHELRTPLTLILSPLDTIREQMPDNDDVLVASRNARRLLRLVNQLLDFQKLRAGKRTLAARPMELGRFTAVCADYFRSACSTKRIKFVAIVGGREIGLREVGSGDSLGGGWISGEPDALEKIVFNFLSNALKFTPSGGEIRLSLDGDDRHMTIAVSDTGPGISNEGLTKLFQVFSQVDGTATREYEGSGLGLALAKSLTEELGGEIGVDTKEGQGSTFWARFPRISAPTSDETSEAAFSIPKWLLDVVDAGATEEESIEDDSDASLVLVIDDLVDMRKLVSRTLRKHGYRVITAADGEQGMAMASEYLPDLVITDWMMPKLTGPEVITRLAEDSRLRSVPVVLLTAKSDEESRLLGTQQGASAYLGKPFNEQELYSTVRNLLAIKAREREVSDLNRMLTETVLKRYLPPTLVDGLVSGALALDTPQLRTVTVLFSDICNFTSVSDSLGPEGIASLLNEYLSIMTDVVFSHQGTIDKFIGDGVMVMFGAPLDMNPEVQARNAVRCAARMQEAMRTFAAACAERNLPSLRMRVGIHQGPAVVGNFGSEHRSDYTCIGPMVNIASRIEAAAYPGDILMSVDVAKYLAANRATDAGEFHLKGIAEPQRLYRLQSIPK